MLIALIWTLLIKKKLHYMKIKRTLIYMVLPLLILTSCEGENNPALEASFQSINFGARQMDQANESEYYSGKEIYDFYKYELITTPKDDDSSIKLEKLSMIMGHIDSIENSCAALISLIENFKFDLLKKQGEEIRLEKNQDPNRIVWKKYNPKIACLPSQLNLFAIKQPQSTKVVQDELVGDSDEKTSKKGQELWEKYTIFRHDILKHVGSYSMSKKTYHLNVKSINQFENQADLKQKVTRMIDLSNINHAEDKSLLIDLYMMLTKNEFVVENGQKVHWINSLFLNAPLVSAISNLSALQHEILQARSLAYRHWKSKGNHCCNGFDQIIPIVSGPSIIKEGESLKIKVSVGGFDSRKNPSVTLDGYPSNVEYSEGLGIVTVQPKKGVQTIRGTVSIRTNSGKLRTEPWEWKVNVLEK